MTFTEFLIYSLATWRIASMLVVEAGPFDIFIRIREHVGIQHDEDGDIVIIPDGFRAGLLSCVWCCSIWVAMGWTAFWLLDPEMAIIFASLFGISAGAILFDKLLSYPQQ